MSFRSIRHVVVGVAAVGGLACSGRDTTAPPALYTLAGRATLQDTWGNDLSDFSDIAITVDGRDAHATTDKNGDWRIDGLRSGTYDLTLKKGAFGAMRILGQKIEGPSTIAPAIAMATTPSHRAIIDSVHIGTLSGMEFYFVDGHLSEPPPANAKMPTTLIFLSRSDKVSADPATYEQWDASFSVGGANPQFTMAIAAAGMRAMFAVGTQVYVVGYGTSAACSCYTDPVTTKRIFTNVGPRGNVVGFIVK